MLVNHEKRISALENMISMKSKSLRKIKESDWVYST